ncbi:hypothetical protein AB0451_24400 [Streptomyces sp. NPDC052000]|uniref:hypothetical protein n=1 Tax=Streptomyces sp. NPDC052000 TaxID=3155676 RepID=UPI00344F72EE
MNLEILVVPTCPHTGPAAALLRQVLDEVGLLATACSTRVIADQAVAEAAAFTGSPTILTDCRDRSPSRAARRGSPIGCTGPATVWPGSPSPTNCAAPPNYQALQQTSS